MTRLNEKKLHKLYLRLDSRSQRWLAGVVFYVGNEAFAFSEYAEIIDILWYAHCAYRGE